MQDGHNLGMALQNLERETQAAVLKLHQDEAKLKQNEAEAQKLQQEIKHCEEEIKTKKGEIVLLENKIKLANTGISKNKSDHTKLAHEYDEAKKKQSDLHLQMTNIERQHAENLRSSGVDVKRFPR